MNNEGGVWLTSELWQVVNKQAESECVTVETWLQRQLAQSVSHDGQTDDAAIEDELLELAIDHFRRLVLEPDEAKVLANAIFGTIVDGDPHQVGPIGASERRYVLRRRAAALIVQIGEGKISLPLKSAARLAISLDSTRTLTSELDKLAA